MASACELGLRIALLVVTVTTPRTNRITAGTTTPPTQMKAFSRRREGSVLFRRPRSNAYTMSAATTR